MTPKTQHLLEVLLESEAFDDFVEHRMLEKLHEWYASCDIPWPNGEDREYYQSLKPALRKVINYMSDPAGILRETEDD